jgi:hypothetical protein
LSAENRRQAVDWSPGGVTGEVRRDGLRIGPDPAEGLRQQSEHVFRLQNASQLNNQFTAIAQSLADLRIAR